MRRLRNSGSGISTVSSKTSCRLYSWQSRLQLKPLVGIILKFTYWRYVLNVSPVKYTFVCWWWDSMYDLASKIPCKLWCLLSWYTQTMDYNNYSSTFILTNQVSDRIFWHKWYSITTLCYCSTICRFNLIPTPCAPSSRKMIRLTKSNFLGRMMQHPTSYFVPNPLTAVKFVHLYLK